MSSPAPQTSTATKPCMHLDIVTLPWVSEKGAGLCAGQIELHGPATASSNHSDFKRLAEPSLRAFCRHPSPEKPTALVSEGLEHTRGGGRGGRKSRLGIERVKGTSLFVRRGSVSNRFFAAQGSQTAGETQGCKAVCLHSFLPKPQLPGRSGTELASAPASNKTCVGSGDVSPLGASGPGDCPSAPRWHIAAYMTWQGLRGG